MTITRMIRTTLAGVGPISNTTLTWDPEVPVKVAAIFTGSDGVPTEWVWALDLFRIGMATVSPNIAGHLDVKVTTDTDGVLVYLSSPEGTAVITLDYAETRAFVDSVTLVNLNESAVMLELVDAFLVTLNQESF